MRYEIEKLTEISEYLKDMDTTVLLHNIKDMLENGNYVLTVMGQFSAGKSTLINELLEKEVLPVNKTETTAVITYIKYGDKEGAELIYADGSVKPCPVEETMSLEQNSEHLEQLEGLESINIYLQNELLKNGLIIADTPGVNTVLKEHTEKTLQLFNASSRIMYVVSGAMNSFDKEFLGSIRAKGLRALVVRTYMDTIYNDEEDASDVIANESDQINKFTDDPVFFISSISTSSFYKNIAELRSYLNKTIAGQASEQLRLSVEDRMISIAQGMLPVVEQRQQALTALLDDRDEEFRKQCSDLTDKAEQLNKALEKGKEKLQERYKKLRDLADETLDSKIKSELRSLAERISDMDFNVAFSVHSDIEEMVHKSCTDLRLGYVNSFDELLRENKNEILSELDSVDMPVYLKVDLPENIEEAGEEADEIRSKIDALLQSREELDKELEESKKRIAEGDAEKEKIEKHTEEINAAIENLHQELIEYGDYVEHYKVKRGDHRYENGMRNFGRVADFLSILIPGEAWVSLGGKIIAGGAKAAEAGAKVAKGADTLADVIRGLHLLKRDRVAQRNNIELPDEGSESSSDFYYLQTTINNAPEENSILDLLSLEYYFAKIGKKFDKPDIVEVDEDYKREYEAGRAKIVKKIEEAAKGAADERIKIEDIRDKKKKEEIYQEELNKRKPKLDQEIAALTKKLSEVKVNRINEISASHYVAAVNDYLKSFGSYISENVMPVINEKFEAYLETYGVELKSQIAAQQESLKALENDFASADRDALREELDRCKEYCEALK